MNGVHRCTALSGRPTRVFASTNPARPSTVRSLRRAPPAPLPGLRPSRVANASGSAVRARLFHCAICTGCTPNADAISLIVRSPRSTATATFALNAALYCRRVAIVGPPRPPAHDLNLDDCPVLGVHFRCLLSIEACSLIWNDLSTRICVSVVPDRYPSYARELRVGQSCTSPSLFSVYGCSTPPVRMTPEASRSCR